MRWTPLIAMLLLSSCAPQVTIVPPGEPVMLVQPITAPAGSVASYAGKDADGNPVWKASSTAVTIPAGYIALPLPAATQPAPAKPTATQPAIAQAASSGADAEDDEDEGAATHPRPVTTESSP